MMEVTPSLQLGRSGQGRVDDDVAGDLDGAFVRVALAFDARVALERAADVVLGIDDRPVVVDLYSLEQRKIAAAARNLWCTGRYSGRLRLYRNKLGHREEWDHGIIGKQLRDEPAKSRIERRSTTRGVGEDRAAAGLEVLAQGVQIFPAERERGPAMNVDERIVNQVGITRKQVFLGRDNVKTERGSAEGVHEVGDGLGGNSSSLPRA